MTEKNNNYEFQPETTAFNMSLATLERINDIFKYNNQCSLSINIRGWLLGLETLLIEVSPMMNEEEQEIFEKLYDQINFVDTPLTVNDKENNFDQRKNIQKADTFLRKILWDKGLTMTKKEDITKRML